MLTMQDDFLQKVSNYILTPFSSWDGFVSALTEGFRSAFSISSKTGPIFLLTSLTAVGVLYFYRRRKDPKLTGVSFLKFAFPGEVYRHRSAITDYKFVTFDFLLKFVIYVPLIAGFSQMIYSFLERATPALPVSFVNETPYFLRIAIVTIFSVAISDFSLFFSHYVLHKIPFLWPFHEIHHSAEVLTPVTVYRAHPVEEMVTLFVGAILGAVTARTYGLLTGDQVTPIMLFGLNLFTFGAFAFAFQLRHSHIWLSYGRVWSRIFISPAQHQIHHSIERKHWNKNYGFVFAFWDTLFGCLYVPKEREEIVFGVPDADERDFLTVRKLYFLPFAKSFRRLKVMITARSFKFDFDQVSDPLRKEYKSYSDQAVAATAKSPYQ